MDKTKTPFLSGKKIVVAGGGIAGLGFAIALHKQWLSEWPTIPPPTVTIYDRDNDPHIDGRLGYSLSLNGHEANSGLLAVRSLGLLEPILSQAIIDAAAGTGKFNFWNADWTNLLGIRFAPYDGLPTSGIRIARRNLRRVLVDAANKTHATIKWGVACTAAEKLSRGRVRVTLLEDSTGQESEEECDLLIAADGASSKIRACLRPDDGLEYAGAVQMGGISKFPSGIPPPLKENWGMLVNGRGVGCFFSPVDKEEVVWAISKLEEQPRPRVKEHTEEQFRAMLAEAMDHGSEFKEPFKTIVEATDRSSAFQIPARDKKPFSHDGNLEDGRVIFIGDSNHAVSPFAGNGANLALMDGWDLAGALCGCDKLGEAVAAYDKKSLPRAWRTLKTSHDRIRQIHVTGFGWMTFRMILWLGSIFFWLRGQ